MIGDQAFVFKRRKPEDPRPIAPANPAEASPQGDPSLGVPPFRPATLKEASAMSRPPLPMPTTQPQAGTRLVMPPARTAREPSEKRTLVVGRGISVHGTVQDAERLVVEGTVEASMIHAAELVVAAGGMFKGEAEVEEADIAGTIDGKLTVRGGLLVRATGTVQGTARCRRLQVEDGGQISGHIEMITEPGTKPAPAPSSPPAMPEA
jgi:cytoskeletal protein CcmA (bactofilin family)